MIEQLISQMGAVQGQHTTVLSGGNNHDFKIYLNPSSSIIQTYAAFTKNYWFSTKRTAQLILDVFPLLLFVSALPFT